jgi:RNA methyltransferase, TrmH family
MLQAHELISSLSNPRIKKLGHLEKASERRAQNLFIIEGLKEIEKAIKAGYQFDTVFYWPQLISAHQVSVLFGKALPLNTFCVTQGVFEKIAIRESSGGIVATAVPKSHVLEQLFFLPNPIYLVIDGVEKPGNLGAMFRTADAAGIDAIIITNRATDLYNPNTIRASLGCVFTVPSAICSAAHAITWLKQHNVKIYSSYLDAAVGYHTINYTQPTAIVMGTEATGLEDNWLTASDANIIIPMQGLADSMNVSAAAAVLMFEARRQRGFNNQQ